MKRIISLGCFLLVCASLLAQQRPQYSQYMMNQFALNPAVAGTEDCLNLRAGYRNQWAGMEGAPKTFYLTANLPIGKPLRTPLGTSKFAHHNWHGLGAKVYNDIAGAIRKSGALMAYSYNLKLARHIRVSFGASFGFQQFSLNGKDFRLAQEQDELLNGKKSTIKPDAGIGIWLYNKNFYYGLSVQQLFGSPIEFNGLNEPTNNIKDRGKLNNHFFTTAGVNLPISIDFDFIPSVMVKFVNPAPISVDLNGKINYKKGLLWVGASYRSFNSLVAMVGTTLLNGQLPIGYSFDLTYNDLMPYNYGTHEIVVGFRWPPAPKVPCPSSYWN